MSAAFVKYDLGPLRGAELVTVAGCGAGERRAESRICLRTYVRGRRWIGLRATAGAPGQPTLGRQAIAAFAPPRLGKQSSRCRPVVVAVCAKLVIASTRNQRSDELESSSAASERQPRTVRLAHHPGQAAVRRARRDC